jgi:predicted outer membrane protein
VRSVCGPGETSLRRCSSPPSGRAASNALIRGASIGALVAFTLCRTAGAQSSAAATPEQAPVEAPTSAPVDAASPPVDGDHAEVAAIVMQSVSEVKLCGLATQKSQNADVRSLCRKASADSARTAIAGMQLARRLGARGVKFESAPETPTVLDSLAQYAGEEFDRKFLIVQIQEGAADEQAIRYGAEFASDAAVKSYENGVLPKIADRVELAEGALRRLAETPP